MLRAVLPGLLLGACVGAGASSSSDGGSGPAAACAVHLERADCESDDACVWAEADDGSTWCLPEPPDCRVQGCPDGLSCVQLEIVCAPRCTASPDCCVPWHTCQRVDAGVVDE